MLTLYAAPRLQLSRTLRIWISNTVEDQIWQGNGLNVDAFDFIPTMEASYRVTIEGRLLNDGVITDEEAEVGHDAAAGPDDPMDQDEPSSKKPVPAAAAGSSTTSRFSHFFKAITVDFDRSRFRNGAEQTVEWTKPEIPTKPQCAGNLSAAVDFDQLTFKRNGDENTNIVINLHRHETPERFLLSPELAEVVDMSEATQQEAVMALWEYIRFWGLQEDEEKRNFRCDELLRKASLCRKPGGPAMRNLTNRDSRLSDEEMLATYPCSTNTLLSTSGLYRPSACPLPSESMRNSIGTPSRRCTTCRS